MEYNARTIRALTILVVLLTGIYLTLYLIPPPVGYDVSEDEISLLSIQPDHVVSVLLTVGDEQHTYEKEDGKWFLDGAETDYNAADLAVTYLSYLYSDNYIADGTDNLEQYGLLPPRGTAEFTTDSGETHHILYGIETVDGDSRYMMYDEDESIYTVPVAAFEVVFQ